MSMRFRCNMRADFGLFVLVASLLMCAHAADEASPVSVEIIEASLTPAAATVYLAPLPDQKLADSRVLLWNDEGPLGWFEPIAARSDAKRWAYSASLATTPTKPLEQYRATLFTKFVSPATLATAGGTHFIARISSVGPANKSAWLNIGSDHGVRVGDEWLVEFGQPAARLVTTFVEAQRSSVTVQPLVADLPLRVGDAARLWPGPAARKSRGVQSAVSFVEATESGTRLWVPLPQSVSIKEETHAEIRRDGELVALAIVERVAVPFSYLRVLAVLRESKEHRRTKMARSEDAVVLVGDQVRLRGKQSAQRREFIPRVFDRSGNLHLINAGENDGVRAGDAGAIFRAGRRIGEARIVRVQRTYALIETSDDVHVRLGDAFHFSRNGSGKPDVAKRLGQIRGTTLLADVFRCELANDGNFSPWSLVEIRQRETVIANAWLFRTEAGAAFCVVVPGTKCAEIEAGQMVTLPSVLSR